MFVALKPGFQSLATLKLVVNVLANSKPKRTVAASRGFLATARLSCFLKVCHFCRASGNELLARRLIRASLQTSAYKSSKVAEIIRK